MPFETDLKIAPIFSTCRTQYQQNDTKNPTTVFLDTIRSTVTIRYGKGRKVMIASMPLSCSGFSSGTNIGSPISAIIRSRQSADFTLSRLEVPYISGITNRSRIAGKRVCLMFSRKFEFVMVNRFLASKGQPSFPLFAIHKDGQPHKRQGNNGNSNPV